MECIETIESVDKIYDKLVGAIKSKETPIRYTIEEVIPSDDCNLALTPDDFTIVTAPDAENVRVMVSKEWDDEDKKSGLIPSQVIVKLSNGKEYVLNNENKWSVTIIKLPKYKGIQEKARSIFCKYLTSESISDKEEYFVHTAFGNASKRDIMIQILKYALVSSSDPKVLEEAPMFDLFRNIYLSNFKNGRLNPEQIKSKIFSRDYNIELILEDFVKCRCEKRIPCDYEKKTGNACIDKLIASLTPTGKKNNSSIFDGVKSFLLNRSRLDVVSGKNKSVRRSLGKRISGSIVKNDNDELCDDGILLLKHPNDYTFRLVAAAKSGTSINNECLLALTNLSNWFKDLNPNYKYDTEALQKLLEYELERIDVMIKSLDKTYVDMAVALDYKDKTVVSSKSLGKQDFVILDGDETSIRSHMRSMGAYVIIGNQGKKAMAQFSKEMSSLNECNQILLTEVGSADQKVSFRVVEDEDIDAFVNGRSPVVQLTKVH